MEPEQPDKITDKTCYVASQGLTKIVVPLSEPLTQPATTKTLAYAARQKGKRSNNVNLTQISESLVKLEQIDETTQNEHAKIVARDVMEVARAIVCIDEGKQCIEEIIMEHHSS